VIVLPRCADGSRYSPGRPWLLPRLSSDSAREWRPLILSRIETAPTATRPGLALSVLGSGWRLLPDVFQR
jgi:hypothetical protein